MYEVADFFIAHWMEEICNGNQDINWTLLRICADRYERNVTLKTIATKHGLSIYNVRKELDKMPESSFSWYRHAYAMCQKPKAVFLRRVA